MKSQVSNVGTLFPNVKFLKCRTNITEEKSVCVVMGVLDGERKERIDNQQRKIDGGQPDQSSMAYV